MEAGPQIKDFFADGSPLLADESLTAERVAAEVDQIAELAGSVSGRVLDVGCRLGAHSLELASRFADVTGIDASADMVEAARARALDAGEVADFICVDTADFREIARYDLAISVGSDFGRQPNGRHNDEPHVAALDRVYKALRPGGVLVVEVADKQRFVPELVDAERHDLTKITRWFDKRESTIVERHRVASGDIYRHFYRVFDKTELADLLHDVGFEVVQVLDRGLHESSPHLMTFLAQRPT